MRVDHVGSLLRPESLKQAFRDHALGALDAVLSFRVPATAKLALVRSFPLEEFQIL